MDFGGRYGHHGRVVRKPGVLRLRAIRPLPACIPAQTCYFSGRTQNQLRGTLVATIMIAEDDASNRDLLSEMIRGWGYSVIEARNGAEALEKVTESLPDLVVCDIRMPVLDGVGFVRAIRRDNRLANLPVIALTGFDAEDHDAILSAGFTTYQSKPVSSELLRRNLERLLNRRR